MSGQGIGQILFYAAALIVLAYPLGLYMARVYNDEQFGMRGRLRFLGKIENGVPPPPPRRRSAASRTGRATRRRC